MFQNFLDLGNLVGLYSGSPLLGAVGAVKYSVEANPGSQIPGMIFLYVMSIVIAIMVLMIASYWVIFQKAGEAGWKSIIPVYNVIVLLKIVKMSPWWILVVFIPFVGSLAFFIVSIILNIKLAKAFGKGEGFAVGLIIVPVVFLPMLAFGRSQFMGVNSGSVQNLTQEPQNPTPTV